MILAAGRGMRLRPLTDHTPKPLLEVGGHPLLAYGLGLLRAAGIEDVVVNLHHLGERIASALGDGAGYGVRIHYSTETTLLDTGGGIRHACGLLDEIGRSAGDDRSPIVVLNGDVISEIPVGEVLRLHRERAALVTMVLREDPRAAHYGLFAVDQDGRIRRFLGEGDPDTTLPELMFASLHVIDRSVIDRMPQGCAFGTMRDLYPRLFRAGERFAGFVYRGRWLTADTPEDLARTQAELHRSGLPGYMHGLPRRARPSPG